MCVWGGRGQSLHTEQREGKVGFYGSLLPLLLRTQTGVKCHNWGQPSISPKGRNAFVISANINCAETIVGLTFISGMWVMSHRKALFIFLFVVFRAGFYFSQENDGSFNNIVSLFSPKTFLMSVPLIEKLLPLTFLQAKSFLAVSGVPRPDRQPQGCSSGIACCPAQPWSSP